MSWKALPESRTMQSYKTSIREIERLRQLAARDLADADDITLFVTPF